MTYLKDDALHSPSGPHHVRHLAFRGDIDELHEFYEQVTLWGIDLIKRVRFKQCERTSLMLLTLDIVGGDPDSIVSMVTNEKRVWGTITLRAVREG